MDVTSKASVVEAVDEILDRFGKIDILVNNAGVNHRVEVLEYPEEKWDLVIDTNLKGYFLATRASDFITGQTIYIDGGWTAW